MAHRVEIIPASAGRSLPDQLANGVVIPGLRPIRSWYLAGCEGLRDAPKGRDALVLDFLNYGQGDLEMLRSIFGKLGSRAGSAGSAGGGRILVDDSEVGLQSAEAVQNPSADSSEEMTLLETLKVRWLDIRNAALVNLACGDESLLDKFSEPLGGIGINLV